MQDAAAQLIALRHYRTLWFGQEWDAVAAAWQTEYDAVSSGAFKPLQILSRAFDGESSSARENFEQPIRLAALMAYRAERDDDYAAEIYAALPAAAEGPTVTYPVFSQNAFQH